MRCKSKIYKYNYILPTSNLFQTNMSSQTTEQGLLLGNETIISSSPSRAELLLLQRKIADLTTKLDEKEMQIENLRFRAKQRQQTLLLSTKGGDSGNSEDKAMQERIYGWCKAAGISPPPPPTTGLQSPISTTSLSLSSASALSIGGEGDYPSSPCYPSAVREADGGTLTDSLGTGQVLDGAGGSVKCYHFDTTSDNNNNSSEIGLSRGKETAYQSSDDGDGEFREFEDTSSPTSPSGTQSGDNELTARELYFIILQVCTHAK